jgi:hypothetical protein
MQQASGFCHWEAAGMLLFTAAAAIFSEIFHNGVSLGENRRVRKTRT